MLIAIGTIAPVLAAQVQIRVKRDNETYVDVLAAPAASGAFFNISRKLPGGNFLPLGGAPGGTPESGRRMFFTDATLPTSAAGEGAQYVIQGFRGTRAGEASDAITVQFGIDGSGATVTGATLKMAA
ncbi:MAG: hypothetical protein AB7K52_14200 [Phycisphaerales bacterium]